MKPLVHRKRKRVRHAPPTRVKLHVAKGDTVQVMSGDDKGKRGAVLRVFPKTGRLTVQGVNLQVKHQRPSNTAQGGKVVREGPIHHSKVMLIDPKSNTPTRVRRQRDADGTVERIAVKSGQPIARSR